MSTAIQLADALAITLDKLCREDMYYSIGGHPGFAIPAESGVKKDQCYLQFMRNDKEDGSLEYIRINSEGLAHMAETVKNL